MPLTEPYQQIRHKKLIDLIDRPQWTGTAPDGEPFIRQAEDTLIPDLISIVYLDGVCQFIIFDAKYYNLQLEHDKKLRGQPGIESITEHSIYKKKQAASARFVFCLARLSGRAFLYLFPNRSA